MKSVEDIATESAGDAAQALLDRHFRATGIQALPDMLQPFVFDHYLLAARHAIISLQDVLNDKGETCPRTGIICPVTLRAARSAVTRLGAGILHACARARRDQAYAFARTNRALRPLVAGPNGTKGARITAAEAFLPPDIHLSLVEHQKRLASWI